MTTNAKQPTILELQAVIRQYVVDRDWDQFHNPKDLSITLLLEAAEVLEHFQWKSPQEMQEHVVTHKTDVGEELADVFFCLLNLADKLDIDIIDAFEKKMVKNAKKYPVEKSRGNHKKYTELD